MLSDIKKYRLPQDAMYQFTEIAFIQSLEMLENLPETVYRSGDFFFFLVICGWNGFAWCESMLESLVYKCKSNTKKNLFLIFGLSLN